MGDIGGLFEEDLVFCGGGDRSGCGTVVTSPFFPFMPLLFVLVEPPLPLAGLPFGGGTFGCPPRPTDFEEA